MAGAIVTKQQYQKIHTPSYGIMNGTTTGTETIFYYPTANLTDNWIAPLAGEIVGLSVSATTAATSGTLTFAVFTTVQVTNTTIGFTLSGTVTGQLAGFSFVPIGSRTAFAAGATLRVATFGGSAVQFHGYIMVRYTP